VIEEALRESLSLSETSQVSGETERFSDGQESLDDGHGGTGDLFFFVDDTSSLIEAVVHTTHSVLGSGNFGDEDGFLESGFSGEQASVEESSGGGENLTSTSVDGIGVENAILEVHSDTSHAFFGHGSFLGGPLPGRFDGVLNIGNVLDTLGLIDDQIRAVVFRTERPELSTSLSSVPAVLISKVSNSGLGVVLGVDGSLFDVFSETILKRSSLSVDSVVLVGRLGHADLVGFSGNGFLVSNDGVGLDDGAVSVIFFEILQANFDMELSATGDNVLTGGFFSGADNERVRLGKLLETIDELGEITGVLDGDGDSDDRRDGVLHGSNGVSIGMIGDGTSLEDELIDTNETDGVTAGNVGNVFGGTALHNEGSLEGLFMEIVLLSRNVVRSEDSNLLRGGDGTGEDSSESDESALVGGGNHLGDVHHEGSLGVALSHRLGDLIILRTFVEVRGSVSLSLSGGREMENHHLKNGVGSVEPLGHDGLQEVLALEFSVFLTEGKFEGGEHLVHEFEIVIHTGVGELADGVHDELSESSLDGLSLLVEGVVLPLLVGSIEEIVTPELLHHFILVDVELLGVDTGELGQSESPAFFARTESDGTFVRKNEEVAHVFLVVGIDNDVDHIDNSNEVLVHGFTVVLKFEDGSVDLVDDEDGLDLLLHGLSKHGFGLHANTFNAIDDDEGTIGNSKSSSNFRGEIDVSR
jgi:hypothetical protein